MATAVAKGIAKVRVEAREAEEPKPTLCSRVQIRIPFFWWLCWWDVYFGAEGTVTCSEWSMSLGETRYTVLFADGKSRAYSRRGLRCLKEECS